MLIKKYVKSKKLYQVTFAVPQDQLPEDVEVNSLNVLGDFNNWNEEANPLKFTKSDKTYKTRVEVPAGVYQYRYLINGNQWYNDWAADAYAANEQGADNCVLDTETA